MKTYNVEAVVVLCVDAENEKQAQERTREALKSLVGIDFHQQNAFMSNVRKLGETKESK